MPAPRTIEWIGGPDGHLRLLDQTRLPGEVAFLDCRTADEVRDAIRRLSVRGAPAIGVAAAYGLVLAAQAGDLDAAADRLRASRPTAVNLAWAIERMLCHPAHPSALLAEAHAIASEDEAMCEAIGRHGAALIGDGAGVLTHCNAGGLATGGRGTALAVLFAAADEGKRFHVFADETRPLLQGARLTAWELQQAGIDVTLICDSMAAQVMKEGRVQTRRRRRRPHRRQRRHGEQDRHLRRRRPGEARTASRSTSPLRPRTFDLSLPHGDGIPIEQRDPAR